MQGDKNDTFEDALQDILTSEDPKSPPHTAQPIKEKKHVDAKKPDIHQRNSKKIPKWLETIIRVLAGIIILVLLFLFGLQVASR